MFSLTGDYMASKIRWVAHVVWLFCWGTDTIFCFPLRMHYNIYVWTYACYKDFNLLSFLCLRLKRQPEVCGGVLYPHSFDALSKGKGSLHNSWVTLVGALGGDTSPKRGWAHSTLVLGEAYMDTLPGIATLFQQALAPEWLNSRWGDGLPI